MINPNIFRWFKTALKWEIIIICASFTMIMPWHPAHAWSSQETVWNGEYVYVPGGSTAMRDFCREPGRSSDWEYSSGMCKFRSNPAIYPDGYLISGSPTNPNANTVNSDYETISDEQGTVYPGHPDYTPPSGGAPDISSCTRTRFGFNTGSAGSVVFPGLNHRFRDSDGCVYKVVPSGTAVDSCSSYPDSDNPDDVWCYYNVEPDSTTEPPSDNGDPQPPTSAPSDTATDSSSTTDIVVSPTETLPDGTTIDVTTETTTTVDDVGFTIDTTTSEILITNTDGTTTTETTTTTVTTHPDGSYTIREDVVTERVRPDGSRTRVRREDGEIVSIDVVPGFTSRDENFTEENYSPNGSPTGGSSGGSSSGTGNIPGLGGGTGSGGQGGEGDSLGAFCDWADIVCQLAEWFLDEPLYPENPEIPFTEMDLSDIDGFDSGIGAGQCPADNVINTRFGAVPISWALPCQLAETFRPIVLFFAWITALYIVVRVK